MKATTIHLVIAIAVSSRWVMKQLDVRNAFLHGNLKETVYTEQPSSFLGKHHPNYDCKLHKSLYELKQAPRAWFECLSKELVKLGFYSSKADSSLFILRSNSTLILILIYVDDAIITGNNQEKIEYVIRTLSYRFSLKDLGKLNYFLVIEVKTFNHGVFDAGQIHKGFVG